MGDLMQWTVGYHDENSRMSAIPVDGFEKAIEVVARLMRDGKSVTAIRHGTGASEVQALIGAAKEPDPPRGV
jgi:hypothetical protein